MGVTRVDRLSDEEKARFNEWADRWIDVGLRTGDADREKFEAAVRDCYRFAGIDWPDVVVWVPSPMVMALAAPAAAYAIELIEAQQRRNPGAAATALLPGKPAVGGAVRDAVDGAVRGAVDGAVDGAVGGAVRGAVDGAVDGAVRGAVRGAVDGAVRDAVDGAVDGAVRGAVDGAVDGAVGGAVDDAVDGAVRGAVRDAVRDAVDGAVDGAVRDAVDDAVGGAVGGAVRGAVRDAVRDAVGRTISQSWYRYMGGQFWVGCWGWWGGAYTSYFREVCNLDLPGDLWDRGRAYEATMESACWWWPHRRFVMVCERPTEIHRELTDPTVDRGWNSHRLHNDTGPAVRFRDGWSVYAIHGARVPAQVVEAPHTLTVEQITGETNAEVRRIMLDRYGHDRYIRESRAQKLHADEWGTLWRTPIPGDEPLVMVQVTNSSPEPDGTFKDYWLRVDPELRPLLDDDGNKGPAQKMTVSNAIASTFGLTGEQYVRELAAQT